MKRNQYKILIVSIMILLFSVLPMFIISLFSRPCADDYSYAINTYHLIQSGDWNILSLLKAAWDVDVHFYYTWQGLYSSAFVLALQPGIFGEQYYFVGAWILMLLLFLSLYFLTNSIAKCFGNIARSYTIMFSLFLFVTLMQGMPSLIQGIYWFNGAWNYTFFFCMLLMNVALIIKYASSQKGYGALLFSTVLSFLISGGNHITAFLNILILIVAVVLLLKRKPVLFISLSSAIIGFIIMYRAPGTALRQGTEMKQGVISTIVHSVWGCYNYLCDWMNVQWIVFLLLLIPVAFYMADHSGIEINSLKLHPIIMAAIGIMFICGMLCVPYMAMGNFGEERVKNVIWFTFMILSAVNWIYFLLWSKAWELFKKIDFKKTHMFCIMAASFLICFYPKANVWQTTKELVLGQAAQYAVECDKRYELMEQNSGETILYVDKLPESEVLNFSDLTADVAHWSNSAWRDYYGVDMVIKE